MLHWTKNFETGHAEIDSQHKTLINYINQLEGLCHTTNPNRQEAEFIPNLIDFIEDYTAVHFCHEEACMHRHECPAHDENKAAHAMFLQIFRQFKLQFETEGYRSGRLKEFHEMCCTWIEEHILQIDTQLRPPPSRAAKLGKAG